MTPAARLRAAWWLIPIGMLWLDLLVIGLVQPRDPVRDEQVFFPAAQSFAQAGWLPSLDFLRHYAAPQAPLALYLAGRWLTLLPSLTSLRVLDALLMAGALLRFAWCTRSFGKHAQLGTALLAINPYVHLAATHFYTDALYFLLAVLIVTRTSPRPAWRSLTLAPLARQFGVIFPLGEALHAITKGRLGNALLAFLTLVPLLALCLLWRGFAPDTPRAQVARNVHALYGPIFPYIAAYHLSALGFYLAPVACVIKRSRRFLVGGLLCAAFYALAPAHANFSSLLAHVDVSTLGYLHRATLLLGVGGSHCALCAFCFLGGGLVAETLAKDGPARFFVVLFVIISALNFQAWDKYLLDVLPVMLLALLAPPVTATALLRDAPR